MTDEKKSAVPEATEGVTGSANAKLTRRRFTKAGATVPFVMTLAGRPVWGAECLTASAGASGDASSARAAGGGLAEGTQGRSVDYWLSHPSDWLAKSNVATYKVESPGSLKGLVVTILKPDAEGLFHQLIRGAGDKHAELAAAKLNARKLPDFGYSEPDIENLDLEDPYALSFLICLNGRSLDKDVVSLLEISKVRKVDSSIPASTKMQADEDSSAAGKEVSPKDDAKLNDNKCISVTSIPFIQVSDDLGPIAAYGVSDSDLTSAVEGNCRGD
jgi:hypothetical protein